MGQYRHAHTQTYTPSKMVRQLATDEEFKQALESNKRVVVDFTATWCPPCRAIAPIFEQLAAEHADITFVRVDVDENEEASATAGISCMPTFQFYLDGKKVAQMEGADQNGLKTKIGELAAM